MRGKYSPTVSMAYIKDQEWWNNYSKQSEGYAEFDPDGYDNYGYNKDGVDRAGYEEFEYYKSDEFDSNWSYDQCLEDWGFDGIKPVLCR